MKALLIRRSAALARDERGASIVELALLAPVLGTLILGMIDLGQGFSARHDLQRAANRAIELAQTRRVSRSSDDTEVSYQFVVNEAATAAGVATSAVTLTRWRECDRVVQLPRNNTAVFEAVCTPDSSGNPREVARYLKVKIVSSYSPMLRFGPIALSPVANADGSIPMTVEAAVRIQ